MSLDGLPPERGLDSMPMATAERDSTEEWLLPESARPPLLSELEARIEEAMATAKATESAVVTIGAAAIDAAEQARYAAELAERASAAMLAGGGAPRGEPALDGAAAPTDGPAAPTDGPHPASSEGPAPGDDLADFNERADRLTARLAQFQADESPALEP
jgi:hypothetical protein